jgi:hypothetical protein
MPKHLFCDEAGSTGPNLLDPAQPFFAYAVVAIEPEEAAALVDRLVSEFKPQGSELKGRHLVGSNRGRKLVSALLRECAGRVKVSVWHKRFALATQFFEHTFEPVLAEQNSLFYRSGFHQFISNLLFLSFSAGDARAMHTMEAFQRIVRARGAEPVDRLFPETDSLSERLHELSDIETFVLCHRSRIANCIDTSGEADPMYRWSLDASFSAIWQLLMAWSAELDPESLIVTCDTLKPLYEVRDRFNIMIGRADRPMLDYPTDRISPIYNLSEPVRFGNSEEHAGIQIADVVAAAMTTAFRDLGDKQSIEWVERIGEGIHAIVPDVRWIDLQTEEGVVNALILRELADRSVRQVDLFDGMGVFINCASESFEAFARGLATSETGTSQRPKGELA